MKVFFFKDVDIKFGDFAIDEDFFNIWKKKSRLLQFLIMLYHLPEVDAQQLKVCDGLKFIYL